MSEPQVEIKLFDAGQLKQWLFHNQTIPGLSEAVISRSRAEAIIANPYIKEDDPVAAAVLEGEKVVAFTASFPDKIGDKIYHWFSTLWCSPERRGKGYGLFVVGSMSEVWGAENCLDMWGAPETVSIFKYLGHKTEYITEYRFEPKHINRGTLKGEAAWWINRIRKTFRKIGVVQPVQKLDYLLEYTNGIDDESYRFIQRHGMSDLVPRTQEMMNWILSSHFKKRTPLTSHQTEGNPFEDVDKRYWMSGVKVLVDGNLAGFYMLRDAETELSVKYLYYDDKYVDYVFSSIAEHIVTLDNPGFSTRNRRLAEYVSGLNRFDREIEVPISFSHPEDFEFSSDAIAQGGDGDGFV